MLDTTEAEWDIKRRTDESVRLDLFA